MPGGCRGPMGGVRRHRRYRRAGRGLRRQSTCGSVSPVASVAGLTRKGSDLRRIKVSLELFGVAAAAILLLGCVSVDRRLAAARCRVELNGGGGRSWRGAVGRPARRSSRRTTWFGDSPGARRTASATAWSRRCRSRSRSSEIDLSDDPSPSAPTPLRRRSPSPSSSAIPSSRPPTCSGPLADTVRVPRSPLVRSASDGGISDESARVHRREARPKSVMGTFCTQCLHRRRERRGPAGRLHPVITGRRPTA